MKNSTMKNNIFIILCIITSLSGMDHPNTCLSDLLKTYNIETEGKEIISFGCGIGKTEAQLAKKALSVRVICASKSMIEHAQKKYLTDQTNNLSFEHCLPEDFIATKPYDLVFYSALFYSFQDNPRTLQAIHASLKPGGIFITLQTKKEEQDRNGLVDATIPTPSFFDNDLYFRCRNESRIYKQFHNMLTQKNFEITQHCQEWSTIMTKNEIKEICLCMIPEIPFAKTIIDLASNNSWCHSICEWVYSSLSTDKLTEQDTPFLEGNTNEFVEKIRQNNLYRYIFNAAIDDFIEELTDNHDDTYTTKDEITITIAQKRADCEPQYYH